MNREYHQLFVDPAGPNQIKNQDEWTNPILIPAKQWIQERMTTYQSLAVKLSLKNVQKIRKRHTNSIYEDQHIDGDEDSSKFQRRSSRVRKSVDTFILFDVNTQKSNPNTQMDDSDEREDSFALKNHHQSMKGENCQISSP